MRYYLLLIVIASFFMACENETGSLDSDLGLDYFPLEVGKYINYQVDSTTYDNEGLIVLSTTSFVREEVVGMFLDNAADTSYRIHRFYKAGMNDEWILTDVWTSSKNLTQAVRTEENLRFIKLVFPPKEGLSWNGNTHIDPLINIEIAGDPVQMFKNWDYQILNIDRPETIGLLQFDEVLTVQMADDENVIERRFAREKYARDVGLVFREFIILDTQCIELCEGQSWEEKAWQGFTMQQIVIEHN
jgi:hypothetical protein